MNNGKNHHHDDCCDQHVVDETNSIAASQSGKSKTQAKNVADHKLEQQQKRSIEDQTLKLIVRSPYWGRILKGKNVVRNVYTKNVNGTGSNKIIPRVISSQAILHKADGFWGCCPNHGKRVLEMQECHFSDSADGFDWDLYLVGTWFSPSHSIHDFFLLPQNRNTVDVSRNVMFNGWSYVGTCKAGNIRSGLDDMLRSLLQENEVTYGHRYHHVHIDVMMDQVFDRETPRSRKINNEKARMEQKNGVAMNTSISKGICKHHRQESSVTTEGTASTDQESPQSIMSKMGSNVNNAFVLQSVVGAPPIPSVISNDASSMFPYSGMSHSAANTNNIAYRDHNWAGSYWNALSNIPPQYHSYPMSGNLESFAPGSDYHGMSYYSAKPTPFISGNLLPQQQHPYFHLLPPVPFSGVHSPIVHPSLDMHHQNYVMFPEPHAGYLNSFKQHYQQVPVAPPATNADTGYGCMTNGHPFIVENTLNDISSKFIQATCVTLNDTTSSSPSPSAMLNNTSPKLEGAAVVAELQHIQPIVPTPSQLLLSTTE